MKQYQAYAAEFIATFALIFFGAGAVVMNTITNGALGLLGIAFAHGMVLMCMIYATGRISGAHINPAVTVAMWIARKIDSKKATFYVISQLLGASVAGFFLLMLFPTAPAHLGAPDLAGIGFLQGILLEAVRYEKCGRTNHRPECHERVLPHGKPHNNRQEYGYDCIEPHALL